MSASLMRSSGTGWPSTVGAGVESGRDSDGVGAVGDAAGEGDFVAPASIVGAGLESGRDSDGIGAAGEGDFVAPAWQPTVAITAMASATIIHFILRERTTRPD